MKLKKVSGQEAQRMGAGLLCEKQRFCKEAIMWKHVSCPYILKLNGVFRRNDIPAIVTPWMPHGNITEYLEKHPDADRLYLVNLNILQAPSVGSPYTLSLRSFYVWQKDSGTFITATLPMETSKR